MAGLHATIGVLAALRRAARDRRRPARRGQPAVVGALGHGQPVQRVRRRGHGAVPDGQQPPEPVPLRAAALRRPRPDRHRGQQRHSSASSVEVLGVPGRWPTTRGSPATRTAPPTATSSGRCWSSGCATRTAMEWFARHHRRRRPVRPDQHDRRRRGVRRGGRPGPGGERSGTGAAPCRRCATRSASRRRGRPTTCRRPRLDEHGDEIRELAGPSRGREDERATASTRPSLGTSTAEEITAAGP